VSSYPTGINVGSSVHSTRCPAVNNVGSSVRFTRKPAFFNLVSSIRAIYAIMRRLKGIPDISARYNLATARTGTTENAFNVMHAGSCHAFLRLDGTSIFVGRLHPVSLIEQHRRLDLAQLTLLLNCVPIPHLHPQSYSRSDYPSNATDKSGTLLYCAPIPHLHTPKFQDQTTSQKPLMRAGFDYASHRTRVGTRFSRLRNHQNKAESYHGERFLNG
jgi:hypothetical protein